MQRTITEQTLFRFGYAVGLLRGAEKIRDCKEPMPLVGLSAYLLICFSIENALAAHLIAHQHPYPGDYKSHDLVRAMKPCASSGLVFSRESIKFIEFVTPLHKDFVFRYPERLNEIKPPDLTEACRITREILTDVHIVLKMKGFDLAEAADAL